MLATTAAIQKVSVIAWKLASVRVIGFASVAGIEALIFVIFLHEIGYFRCSLTDTELLGEL